MTIAELQCKLDEIIKAGASPDTPVDLDEGQRFRSLTHVELFEGHVVLESST